MNYKKKLLLITILFPLLVGHFSKAADSKKETHSQVINEINQTLGSADQASYLNVPGEFSTGDDGTIDPPYAYQFIKEICGKHTNKDIQKIVRARTLVMLKQMESAGLRNEEDRDPNEAERKKILSERKRIRKELTDILNKECS